MPPQRYSGFTQFDQLEPQLLHAKQCTRPIDDTVCMQILITCSDTTQVIFYNDDDDDDDENRRESTDNDEATDRFIERLFNK